MSSHVTPSPLESARNCLSGWADARIHRRLLQRWSDLRRSDWVPKEDIRTPAPLCGVGRQRTWQVDSPVWATRPNLERSLDKVVLCRVDTGWTTLDADPSTTSLPLPSSPPPSLPLAPIFPSPCAALCLRCRGYMARLRKRTADGLNQAADGMSPTNANAFAELIGTFLEVLCYGMYCIVFCLCLRVLRTKYLEGRPSIVLFSTALCIFVLVTVHCIMDVMRAAQAFTSHMDVPNSAVLYYTVVKRDLDIIKSGCYIAMTVVSDALIGYRTFVVWGKNYFIAVIPIALVFADIGLGIYAVCLLSQVEPGDNALMAIVTDRVKYFYTITLVLNLLCTILISYKIWQVQSEVDRYSPNAVRPRGTRLILIIIESAAIYSAMLVVLITSSALNAVAMLAVLNIISPVIGIVFSMVIIRFSIDRTRWDSLKISTHLNFISGTNNDDDKGELDTPVDPPRAPTDVCGGATGKEKVTVESHVRPASGLGLGFGIERYTDTISLHSLGGSMFSHSKTSLPEFYV